MIYADLRKAMIDTELALAAMDPGPEFDAAMEIHLEACNVVVEFEREALARSVKADAVLAALPADAGARNEAYSARLALTRIARCRGGWLHLGRS